MATNIGHQPDSPVSLINDGKKSLSAVRIEIPSEQSIVTQEKYPKEKKKTLIVFLLLCCSFICVAFSLALTIERLPDRDIYKPLPDIILDNVPAQDWALYVSDILLALSGMATLVVILLHRHRWIVMRRLFLILAYLYTMRSIAFHVTVLPVSSYTYPCSPKSNFTSVLQVVGQVIQMVSGFGFSNGQNSYCGDYIYSGHTVGFVIAYLFIQEYTPRKLFILHWISWIVSWIGVAMMLISHGHYTIDVLIAYYVATRLFWIYHTLANNPQLTVLSSGENGSSNNFLAKLWWYSVFRYMEGNIEGELPKLFSFPWSSEENNRRRSI